MSFVLQQEIPLQDKTLVVVLVRHRQFGAALIDIKSVGGAVLMDFCRGSGQSQLMVPSPAVLQS